MAIWLGQDCSAVRTSRPMRLSFPQEIRWRVVSHHWTGWPNLYNKNRLMNSMCYDYVTTPYNSLRNSHYKISKKKM